MRVRASSFFAGLLIVVLFASMSSAAPTVISDELQPVLAAADESEMVRVVVLMRDRHDVQELSSMMDGLRATDRKALMWNEVSLRADRSQEDLLDNLYRLEQQGKATRIRSLKLANAVDLRATPRVIRQIAQRADVRAIEWMNDEKVIPDPPNSGGSGNELDEICWGVDNVRAPEVWNDLGYTGEGILLAIIDTGCNYEHIDLADHMWNGGADYPNHGYDFYNNDNNPWDDHSHGTHCAGSALGDGTGASQTGVAPDATLMALKIFNSGGSGAESDCWAALDFCIEHAVHVTSLSAGWTNASNTIRESFRDQYDLVNAAGIVNLVASGNEGSWGTIPNQVRTPGTVPPPWHNPDQIEDGGLSGVITVGATDINNNIASFSSRGPVTWQAVSPWFDYAYNPGAGLFKPDVSAPGVNVKSCNYIDSNNNNIYDDYADGWDGTSMATPHAAGAAALLLSIDENFTPAQIDEILETSAVDYGTTGKDNSFGAGRIDTYEACLLAESMATDINIRITPEYDEPYFIPGSGGVLRFAARIRNNYAVNTPGVVWTEAILPNGNTYQIDTYNVVYQPGVDIEAPNAAVQVPGGAPNGYYTFIAKAGLVFGNPISMDEFEFVKFSFDADGDTEWSMTGFEVMDNGAVEVTNVPSEFALGAAYPNPFNPTTSISLSLPQSELVTVSVFNALGQEVATLQNGQLTAGQHIFTFDGSGLSSGVYFISAQAGANHGLQKVVLMK